MDAEWLSAGISALHWLKDKREKWLRKRRGKGTDCVPNNGVVGNENRQTDNTTNVQSGGDLEIRNVFVDARGSVFIPESAKRQDSQTAEGHSAPSKRLVGRHAQSSFFGMAEAEIAERRAKSEEEKDYEE